MPNAFGVEGLSTITHFKNTSQLSVGMGLDFSSSEMSLDGIEASRHGCPVVLIGWPLFAVLLSLLTIGHGEERERPRADRGHVQGHRTKGRHQRRQYGAEDNGGAIRPLGGRRSRGRRRPAGRRSTMPGGARPMCHHCHRRRLPVHYFLLMPTSFHSLTHLVPLLAFLHHILGSFHPEPPRQ